MGPGTCKWDLPCHKVSAALGYECQNKPRTRRNEPRLKYHSSSNARVGHRALRWTHPNLQSGLWRCTRNCSKNKKGDKTRRTLSHENTGACRGQTHGTVPRTIWSKSPRETARRPRRMFTAPSLSTKKHNNTSWYYPSPVGSGDGAFRARLPRWIAWHDEVGPSIPSLFLEDATWILVAACACCLSLASCRH